MAVVLTYAAAVPVVKVGRIAGQFAKPRSSPTEKKNGKELPSYRGDIINGPEFTAEARTPDPQRQLEAYRQSAATLNLVRAFAHGGYASSAASSSGCSISIKVPKSQRYLELADRISEALASCRPAGSISKTIRSCKHDRFLHQPRGAAARLRAGDDARGFDASGHLLRDLRRTWSGSATARASSTTPMSNSAAASTIRSASSAARR